MTEHKFTDDEVIRALECCRDFGDCSLCPYAGATFDDEPDCAEKMHTDALDLINRQKANLQEVITLNSKLEAEIERLESLCEKIGIANDAKFERICVLQEDLEAAKAEAIKEFAERLKAEKAYSTERHENIVPVAVIDWIVKEMTEDATEPTKVSPHEICETGQEFLSKKKE